MPARGLRFLVVEDHPFQRAALVQLLRTMGASQVQEAEDGVAALAVLQGAEPVDIVISDVSMPGMDGIELVRHLSELGTPVSLVLASAVEPGLLATIAAMARGYGVRLLGVVGKPACAANLAPLLDLHRAARQSPDVDASGIPLEELATSWTNHDLDPWFVPELEVTTQSLEAFKAVPRWQHPERGLLGPSVFLPSVRARGLWEEFAWMLLERSARACAHWHSKGIDAAIAVPMLMEGWSDAGLGHRIAALVKQEGIQPSQAELLVPESVFDGAAAAVLENLARLRLEGFALAVTHPAASADAAAKVPGVFSRLRFPAVLAEMEDLQQLLGFPRAAQLRTCAEGVERAGQLQLLMRAGCDLANGPHIGPAMPLHEALEWATRHVRRQARAARSSGGLPAG